ncbi:class E sortase [Diaminobutyricimonas sp. LJ205]|uniref:class E sortase n=1 Tax=Diaminobutyricimonas sp. LJ205 TaxID=2683590 RepID=UPI0012F4F454|nr:class E sortase [Diaminobutyricimonas sp. LJ205]
MTETAELMRPRGSRRTKRHRRASPVTVIAELLITAGVLVLLFLGWQLWFNELVMGSKQHDQALETAQEWERDVEPAPANAEPIVRPEPAADGEIFANLVIPRFGQDYYRPIAQGVGLKAVLNTIGVGHYPGAQMPGEVGNFSLAAHRTSYGRPFNLLAELRKGDKIWVETADGWYEYAYLTQRVIQPTEVEVIEVLPPGLTEVDRYITLTTCHPMWSARERLIAHGVLDQFYPRAAGVPEEIAYTQAQPQAGGQ